MKAGDKYKTVVGIAGVVDEGVHCVVAQEMLNGKGTGKIINGESGNTVMMNVSGGGAVFLTPEQVEAV